MRKPSLIIIFFLGLIVALSAVKSIVSNRLSTSGVFVGEIEDRISRLKTENAILSEVLLTSSSLTNIAIVASEAGFTKENSLMVLKTSRPLAVKQ